MKITLDELKKKDACKDGLKWFKKTFGNQAEHTKIIKELEKEKDCDCWIDWLFENFKLSGICKGWYSDGTKSYEGIIKTGKNMAFIESMITRERNPMNAILKTEREFKEL